MLIYMNSLSTYASIQWTLNTMAFGSFAVSSMTVKLNSDCNSCDYCRSQLLITVKITGNVHRSTYFY